MNVCMKNYGKRDLLILSHLRQDARMKLTELSKKTKIPVSTLFDKIKTYQSRGLVAKNAALVRFEKLGYHRVLITLSCKRQYRETMREVLEKHPSMNSLYRVNNGWDFMAEMLFPGMKEVEDFLDELEDKVKVKNKSVFYVVNDLKKENFLTNTLVLGCDTT